MGKKREKNIVPTRLLEKENKFLMTRNHPPPTPTSRVKWSAPKRVLTMTIFGNFCRLFAIFQVLIFLAIHCNR